MHISSSQSVCQGDHGSRHRFQSSSNDSQELAAFTLRLTLTTAALALRFLLGRLRKVCVFTSFRQTTLNQQKPGLKINNDRIFLLVKERHFSHESVLFLNFLQFLTVAV